MQIPVKNPGKLSFLLGLWYNKTPADLRGNMPGTTESAEKGRFL